MKPMTPTATGANKSLGQTIAQREALKKILAEWEARGRTKGDVRYWRLKAKIRGLDTKISVAYSQPRLI